MTIAPVRDEAIREAQEDVDGVAVTYFDSGDVDEQRPTVVLVHGTGGSTARHFSFLMPMLATRQRVVSIDWTPPADGGVELIHLQNQIVAVLEQIACPRVTLVGYSLGAVVATAVAGNRPDLVENLVLIAGWLRTDVHQQIRNDVWHGVTRLDEHIARKFTVMSSFSPAFLRLRTPEERQRLVDSVTFDEFKTAQMNLNRRIDITAEADRVRAQTLIIGCRDDMMVPTHHSKQLLGAIVNARYVEVAAGHAVVVERPAELVHWIDTFNRDPRRYPAGTIIENPRP